MSLNKSTPKYNPDTLDRVATDLLKPVGLSRGFIIWMTFLILALFACLYAYYIQLQEGLGVTGMRDYVSWGMYISNFVFFVAASLVGMLISGILGLIGYKWIVPIGRIAEIIAIAFAAVAGLVIISDMGRPDRLYYLFTHGKIQSPILWDVTVVTTYFTLSFLLYFFTLLPDLAISKNRIGHTPVWLQKAYNILSFNWQHTPEQYKVLFKIIRILLILIIPTAFAIHTVTSWLFAVTLRPGWDSTIFGPYFLSGAFVAGTASVIVAMRFFRKSYNLKKYLTDYHFDMIGKLLFLVSIVYFYFNINEFLVPGFKLKKMDALHLQALFTGQYALLFWSTQILGLILPMILVLFKKMRKSGPLAFISLFVIAGAWLKRYIIVVPTQEHPFLPMQGVPDMWLVYKPTIIETSITLGSFILVLIIISVLSKLFPIIPIWETAMEQDHSNDKPLGE